MKLSCFARAPLVLLAALTVVVSASEAPKPTYDAKLAKKLGADEYGMKMYSLVMLRTGTNTTMAKAELDRTFAGHMANIQRLAASGKLVFAGPLAKNDRFRGIFIFNVATTDEAQALLATDPAVQAGVLAADIYGLYGSAALQEVNAIHRRIAKADP